MINFRNVWKLGEPLLSLNLRSVLLRHHQVRVYFGILFYRSIKIIDKVLLIESIHIKLIVCALVCKLIAL